MNRLGRGTALLVALVLLVSLALSGCEPSNGPVPAASSSWLAPASAARKALQTAREAKETEEYLDMKNDPWRPGESLLGEWRVTTPYTLALADEYASRIAKKPSRKDYEERDRYMTLRSSASLVTVTRSRFVFLGEWKEAPPGRWSQDVFPREYDVLRDTSGEVEIQFRGDGGRTVLTLRGDSEIHAPGLVDMAGGVTWRRGRRLDVGLP